MKKLFLSLTATLAGMAKGTISNEDLRTGLFLFDSPRDHVARTNLAPNDGEKSWTGFDREVHKNLIGHLKVADRENRVGWVRPTPAGAAGHPMSKHDEFNVLNRLLEQNQLPSVARSRRLTFQGVAESLAVKNAPLQAVY